MQADVVETSVLRKEELRFADYNKFAAGREDADKCHGHSATIHTPMCCSDSNT